MSAPFVGARSALARGAVSAFGAALSAAVFVPAAQAAPLRDSPSGAARAVPVATMAARITLPYNGTIRRVDAPFAVAFNHYSRKIYVTESRRNRVAVFDRLGRRTGSLGEGVLDRPTGLAFDFLGNLAVVSAGSREIAVFHPRGRLILKASVPAELPMGLAFEPRGRRALVTDAATGGVWLTRDGRSWSPRQPEGLDRPLGVDATAGRFFAVGSGDAHLVELDSGGELVDRYRLNGASGAAGVTIPPFGNGAVVSSAGNHSGLFAARLGQRFIRFGGAGRMTAPALPGSECTRVAFPDFVGNRVVAFDLPNAASCVQTLRLRRAVTARSLRSIRLTAVAENDGSVKIGGRALVPSESGRINRYRLPAVTEPLVAAVGKEVRLRIPDVAARALRAALRRRDTALVTLEFFVRNAAGDRRRLTGRLLYRPGVLGRLASASRVGYSVPVAVDP